METIELTKEKIAVGKECPCCEGKRLRFRQQLNTQQCGILNYYKCMDCKENLVERYGEIEIAAR